MGIGRGVDWAPEPGCKKDPVLHSLLSLVPTRESGAFSKCKVQGVGLKSEGPRKRTRNPYKTYSHPRWTE